MQKGRVLICDEKDIPFDSTETYVEPHTVEADFVSGLITSIENKCNAINALFDSIQGDLFEISEIHFDDNGREIADTLKKVFKKSQEDYYFKIHEICSEDIENAWMHNSALGLLYHLQDGTSQTLVIPKIRKNYEEIVKNEDLTKEAKQLECEKYIAFIRNQFGLSEDFR